MPGSVRSDSPNDDVEVFACFRTLNLPSSLGWGGRKRPPHHSFVVEVPGIEPGSVQAHSGLLRV